MPGIGHISYFYPRSPCGERLDTISQPGCALPFLSTLSLRRATLFYNSLCQKNKISIHALLAESDRNSQNIKRRHNISIHALLAESDIIKIRFLFRLPKFLSTLSLRRATSHLSKFSTPQRVFLSTLSLRRATCRAIIAGLRVINFYPRSPCGERPLLL